MVTRPNARSGESDLRHETGAAGPVGCRAARILVIDDEEMLRKAMAEVLKLAGHEVEYAGGGREGIERFRQGAFDVVLTDLGMPGVSGLEVARAVKEVDPETFVILCTGWREIPGSGESLHDKGVDALLAKPFRIRDFLQLIQTSLRTRTVAVS